MSTERKMLIDWAASGLHAVRGGDFSVLREQAEEMVVAVEREAAQKVFNGRRPITSEEGDWLEDHGGGAPHRGAWFEIYTVPADWKIPDVTP